MFFVVAKNRKFIFVRTLHTSHVQTSKNIMQEIAAEIFTWKFLVVTAMIGIALSVIANILTPYAQRSLSRDDARLRIGVVAALVGGVALLGFAICGAAFLAGKHFQLILVPNLTAPGKWAWGFVAIYFIFLPIAAWRMSDSDDQQLSTPTWFFIFAGSWLFAFIIATTVFGK